MNEYKSKKNLRNLIQAYSTSSHRPSYEKLNCKYGLYMEHLSNYINKDITVTKLFEEVGKCKLLILRILSAYIYTHINLSYILIYICKFYLMFAAIDSCFKGKERNQIPMFAVSVTKPFRLTDATYESNFTFITFTVMF